MIYLQKQGSENKNKFDWGNFGHIKKLETIAQGK